MAIAVTGDGVEVVQRWRDRRGVYRPAREVVDTSAHDVALTRKFTPVREFIRQHHYSGSTSQITRAFELHGPGGALVGAATFGEVARLFKPYADGAAQGWLCLTRLVLLDEVAANAESFFVAQCFHALRKEGYSGVVSYSDPVPRTDEHGAVTHAGHFGTTYQALNGIFLGRSRGATKWLLPDGSVFESRCEQKIKTGDQGADYSEALLVKHGAMPRVSSDDRAEWVRSWRDKLCRRLVHSGNFRYQWALDKRLRKHLPTGQSYPKVVIAQA